MTNNKNVQGVGTPQTHTLNEVITIVPQTTYLVKAFPLTDAGNAERLAYHHNDKLRYCHSLGSWLYWTGTHWTIDDGGTYAYKLAKETARNIHLEAQLTHEDNKDQRDRIFKHGSKSEDRKYLMNMLDLAQREDGIAVPISALDRNQWLLNVRNGTINLRNGQLQPHNKEDLLTRIIDVEYDSTAQCPTWDAFLFRIMGGNVDLIRFLQKAVGYALTGDVGEQVMFFLHGQTGANGKSTFLNTIRDLLGAYAISMQPDTFMVKNTSAIPNDIARLKGVRFVSTIEGEEGKRLAESLIKQLTGGDTVTARFLHKEFFDFAPTHKIFFATNHKPLIRGTDNAIWRRIRLIPFEVSIPEGERDKHLPDKLRAEWAGILRWAVEGCLMWQREGLRTPEAVTNATDNYREEMDIIGSFVSDRCVTGPGYRVSMSELFDEYKQWCQDNGEYQMTQNMLGRKLTERGFQVVSNGKMRLREGITVYRNVPSSNPFRAIN